MRRLLLTCAWLLAAMAGGSHAQDASTDTPPTLQERLSEAGALDADGLPLPSFWSYDPEGPARDWLGKPPMDPADIASRPEAYAEALAELGLLIDFEDSSLAVRGAILHDRNTLAYPIEYLVVTEMGSTHEAAVIIRTPPSVIDACLKALGLTPGAGTRILRKDPAPSDEDVRAGLASPWRIYPAHGPRLEIDVAWVDADGRPHDTPLESMLIDVDTLESLDRRDWIYTGSEVESYRQGTKYVNWFKADVEGDVVAIYLADARVCLMERNSLDGVADDQYYTLHPELSPQIGTPVTLTLRVADNPVTKRDPIDGLVFFPPDEEFLAEQREAAAKAEGDAEAGDSADADGSAGTDADAEVGSDADTGADADAAKESPASR